MRNFILLICASFQVAFAQDVIPFRSGDLWGYADTNMTIVVEPQYQQVGEFRHPVTWVKDSSKYGYIDKTGKLITKMEFDKADYFGFGVASVAIGKDKFCIDMKGNRTECRAGCGGVYGGPMGSFRTYKRDGKIGVIKYDKSNYKAAATKHDSLPPMWDELRENLAGYAAVRKDSLWGVIHYTGEIVADVKYEEMQITGTYWTVPSLHFFRVRHEGKYGFLNAKGVLVSEPKYVKVTDFNRGIAKVWIDDTFWFYIDQKGREYFEKE